MTCVIRVLLQPVKNLSFHSYQKSSVTPRHFFDFSFLTSDGEVIPQSINTPMILNLTPTSFTHLIKQYHKATVLPFCSFATHQNDDLYKIFKSIHFISSIAASEHFKKKNERTTDAREIIEIQELNTEYNHHNNVWQR